MWRKIEQKHINILRRLIFFWFLVFPISPLEAQKATDQSGRQAIYNREYVNPVYGYRLTIPDGLKAVSTSAPNPNHGVRIDLAEDVTFVWADAHYVDENSLSGAVETTMSEVRATCGEVEVLKRSKTTLGTLPAILLEYTCGSAPQSLNVVVNALRLQKGYSPIFYQLGFMTGKERTLRDKYAEQFEIIRSGFSLLPLK